MLNNLALRQGVRYSNDSQGLQHCTIGPATAMLAYTLIICIFVYTYMYVYIRVYIYIYIYMVIDVNVRVGLVII